jgi:RNA polymerase primary sigma factor
VWWIRQSILQALAEQARIVRLPLNKIGSINKINKAFNKLEQEYQREPTMDEVAELMETRPDLIEDSLNFSSIHVSMDAPLRDEEGNNMYDVILNDESPSPDNELMDNSLRTEIERSLNTLGEREAEILRYYFGLNSNQPHTLEEIGDEFGLTRERVRQIKEKAIKKLKNQYRNRLLKSYLGR